MTGLAYIGKVLDVLPIPGADFIESLTVVLGEGGKWMGTARKEEFYIGDKCEVYLQDSVLPTTVRFAFMEKYHYRVRMARFKGVPSECLIMPLSVVGEVGADITTAAGVTKYDKPLSATWAQGETRGSFPHFIPKTDEMNFQRMLHAREALDGQPFYITQKIDGMSVTVYRYKDHFGVCTRNLEKRDLPEDPLWILARKYGIDKTLPEGSALQMEVTGPGIQKNRLGLKELQPFVFDAYLIEEQRYTDYLELTELCAVLGVRHSTVPILRTGMVYNHELMTDEALRKLAEGQYPNGHQQEGIVVRPMHYQTVLRDRLSFKVINLLYKD